MTIELTKASPTIDTPRLQHGALVAVAALTGAFILLILQNPLGPITRILMALMAVAAVWKGWMLTRRDPIWLGFVLLLWELFSAWVLIPDKVRPLASYGLTLLFCLPTIPILWRVWKAPRSDFKLYLIYVLWCVITVIYSLAPKFSAAHLMRGLFMFSAITMCSVRARQSGDARRVIRCLMLACIVVTVATAFASAVLPNSITWGTELQMKGPNPDDVDEVARFQGPFDNPSELGQLALVTIGLVMTYFEFAERKERKYLVGAAMLAVGLTALADSRSGLLALAAGSSLYAVWRYRLKGLAVLTAAGILVGALLMVEGSVVAPYLWRGNIWTVTGRTDMWPFVLQQIAARPFFGYGYQTAGEILSSRFFPLWWGPFNEGVHNSVHNGYLSLMVGVGVPAFAFWLYIMLHPWFSLFRQSDDPWRLKRAFFFLVIPLLLVNLDEEMLGECLGASGFVFVMLWALAEQYRLRTIRRKFVARREAIRSAPAAIAALNS